MSKLETDDMDAFILMLRSKTALGRLTDSEVRSVIEFLDAHMSDNEAAPIDEPTLTIEPPPVIPPALAPIEPPPGA